VVGIEVEEALVGEVQAEVRREDEAVIVEEVASLASEVVLRS